MLTKKQHKLLLFLHNYIRANGICPSYDEMAKGTDESSKSGIHRLVAALVERGFVRQIPNRGRAIEVLRLPADIEAPKGAFEVMQRFQEACGGMKIVYTSTVPAGEVWLHDAQMLKAVG